MSLLKHLRVLLLALLAWLSCPAFAAPPGWAVLLEPLQLAAILDTTADVRIIQVTGDYAAGHIPDAVSAPYAQFRGPRENPGALASLEVMTSTVQNLGINADTPVVVVHSGKNSADFGAAARVYWTLKSLGVPLRRRWNNSSQIGVRASSMRVLQITSKACRHPQRVLGLLRALSI